MNAAKIGKFKQLVKMVREADFLSSIGETIMECGSIERVCVGSKCLSEDAAPRCDYTPNRAFYRFEYLDETCFI